ncbi:hypothetical protein ILUMI_03037 [Ignelater luminosus]|uniref:Uncharacterized protein n=1 Tax=Ignelater luminosus TaxID=2038154 RepID=A0A8K0GIQ4_IGNLU|nr:hypothetical protein ILUMI_03037 [Ignelater luminosus]
MKRTQTGTRSAMNHSKAVKKNIKKEKLANEAQTAADGKNSKEMYKKIRQIAGNQRNTNDLPLKDKNGINIYTVNEQVERWHEYLILNIESVDTQLPEAVDSAELSINTDPSTRKEITNALLEMKNGKSAGNDMSTADILKIGVNTTVDILKPLIDKK